MTAKPAKPGKKLRDIQRAFAAGVTLRLTSGYNMQSKWVDGSSARKTASTFIKPNDRLSSFERLEIYNKQYWFRLLDNLYDDFPGLRTLVGDERFQKLSIAYLTKHPSNTYSLRDLGDRMETFLAKEPKWVAPHFKLAWDVVRLEWAHIVAFDGEEMPPLEIDALLDGGDPAKLRLGLQPYLTFLACDYPVDEFLLAVRRRQEPAGEASNAVAEKRTRRSATKIKLPKAEKTWIAIHRSEYAVWYKRLEPEAGVILQALQKGATLQQACERALRGREDDNAFAAKLHGWFAQWASFGWFCQRAPAVRLKASPQK